MIDIRYHIYSLVAVFLALAVGIVIGTSFAQSSPLPEMSKRTVERYENVTRELKREIERATEEVARKDALAKSCQDFCRAVAPIIVKGKLAGQNVAIVRTGDFDELEGGVRQALEAAGARVTSVTHISRTFPFEDENRAAGLLANWGVAPAQQGTSARDRLFGLLAQTLAYARRSDLLPRLQEAGVAEFSGDYYRFNKLVVLIGGSRIERNNSSQTVDVPLIVQLNDLGETVVGCEGSDTGSSYVPAWYTKGIATVDNADTPIGLVAMVCALAGENARFGQRDTADRLIPQSLEAR